jgi:hypothetical protein
MSDKELTEAEKQKLLKDPKAWSKFLAETQKLSKKIAEKVAERELNEEYERTKTLLEKQNKVLDLQIREAQICLQIEEYKKKAKLPKTNSEARLRIIHEVREQILDKRRELETQSSGLDPEPRFLGKSEDHLESVYEQYKTCGECSKVFKTFKNERFCSSKCRFDWVSKHMAKRPLIQEEWSERNNENWSWERIGSEKTESLGTYAIFKKVWKDQK